MYSREDFGRLFEELVARARDGMVVTDTAGSIRFENEAARRLTGQGGENRDGRPFFDLIHPGDRGRVRTAFEAAAAAREPAALIECRALHFDRREINVELLMSPVEGADGTAHVLIHVRDVNERLEMMARLRHAHKLASLGHLAMGVGDDLARVMATIRSQVAHLPTSEAPPFFLRVITKAAETGAALAQQLKAFAEMPSSSREEVDVHALVKDLRRAIGGELWVDTLFAASSVLVRTNRELLRQALVDLVRGFAHAMPEGSVVSIKTRNLSISRRPLWKERSAPVDYLVVEVSNTARGAALCTPRELFEPNAAPPVSAAIMLALIALDGLSSDSGGYVEVSTNSAGATLVALFLPGQ
jgi:two-component system cell cycle sensor histidine kinase/response regulator CckA